MKKIFILLKLLILVNVGTAQVITETSYTATNGMIFKVGQDFKLGQGSNFNKDFVFIYTSPLSIAGSIKLGASWAGYNFRVKEIKNYGNEKRGHKVYLVCGGGNIANYWVEAEEAIRNGEIYVPQEFKHENSNNQSSSLSDELRKLKSLLDDSLITNEEYEIQKKKILDKQ